MFEDFLSSNNDITIYPRIVSGNPKIEVYEVDGDRVIAKFKDLTEGENRVLLKKLKETQDTFDLRVVGGSVEIDFIIDPITVGSGTEQDPYMIYDCLDLDDIRNYIGSGSYFKLENDIDCFYETRRGGSLYIAPNGGWGFEPIGTSGDPFDGTLDGAGHVIKGLYMYRPAQGAASLFRYTTNTAMIIRRLLHNCLHFRGKNTAIVRSIVSRTTYHGER